MVACTSRRKQTLERLNLLFGMLSFTTLLLLGCQQSISTRMLRHVVRTSTLRWVSFSGTREPRCNITSLPFSIHCRQWCPRSVSIKRILAALPKRVLIPARNALRLLTITPRPQFQTQRFTKSSHYDCPTALRRAGQTHLRDPRCLPKGFRRPHDGRPISVPDEVPQDGSNTLCFLPRLSISLLP